MDILFLDKVDLRIRTIIQTKAHFMTKNSQQS